MLVTQKRKPVGMLHNLQRRSIRLPTGGGSLARFNFHKLVALAGFAPAPDGL